MSIETWYAVQWKGYWSQETWRSFYQHKDYEEAKEEFARCMAQEDIHNEYRLIKIDILVLNSGPKKVSKSEVAQ